MAELFVKDYPYIGLAPMEGVSDYVFRSICMDFGADLCITEFVSAKALVMNAQKSFQKMKLIGGAAGSQSSGAAASQNTGGTSQNNFHAAAHPQARSTMASAKKLNGIQIFGGEEKDLCKAAEIASELKPDFVDINWGCPVRKVVNIGAGSAILKDFPKMIRLTAMVKKKLEEVKMPLTIKTRLAWDSTSEQTKDHAEELQDTGIEALFLHGRTRAALYSGQANHEAAREIKANPRIKIPIFANGDITSVSSANELVKNIGVDGVLIGRAAMGSPWVFSKEGFEPSLDQKIELCLRHLQGLNEYYGERVGAQLIKIHYSGYFRFCVGFKPYKEKLMRSSNIEEVREILSQYRASLENIG